VADQKIGTHLQINYLAAKGTGQTSIWFTDVLVWLATEDC